MRRLNQTIWAVSWVSWTTRLPAVLLLCLSVLTNAHSHSPQREGQSYLDGGRVKAQQQYHLLEHPVQEPTLLTFKTRTSMASPPLLLTSSQLQLFRRHSRSHADGHNLKAGKKTKHQEQTKHHDQDQREHSGRGSKAVRHCSKSSSSDIRNYREKAPSASSQLRSTKQDKTKADNGDKRTAKTKAKKIKSTLKNKTVELPGPNFKKAAAKTFRQSTFRKHGKQYLFSHEDWYTQYRRNRSGPNSVMRKLTLESNRRRKAMVTIEPAAPLNDDSVGSIEQEYGSPSALPSSLRGNGIVSGQEGGEEDAEDTSDDEAGLDNMRTPEIQGVKRPPTVSAGPVPRPVMFRPAGLVPKARSNGGGSSGMTCSRDAAVRTEAIALTIALVLLCTGVPL